MSILSRVNAAFRRIPWGIPVGVQLSALYTLVLVATLALLGWALYARLEGFLVSNTAERLDQMTRPVLAGHRPPMLGTDQLVRDLSRSDVTVAVLDEQGEVVASLLAYSGDDTPTVPALPDGWQEAVSNGTRIQWISTAPGGERQLVMLTPITLWTRDGPLKSFYLEQAISLAPADAVLNQLRVYILLGILVGSAIGVTAGLALTRTILRPLDRMVTTAEAIAGGDLTRRVALPPGRNEVARLGGAFDHMVERLAATLQAQRRFVADASHELRTPLTSLEGLSEMLLIGADRGDSGTVQRTARSIHSELGRMARLVADLLTLSRLDSAAPMTFVPVDVGRLLDDLAGQMAPLAEARQINLTVTCQGAVVVQAEPDRLKQVVLNLVDNALRYTPPGGQIALSAMPDEAARTVRIQVRDTGPGIAPEDLPHIFDRFYRGDPSRARATGNTGLGLAIARAIVEAHHGKIEVQSTPGAGATFTVSLPVAPATPTTDGRRRPVTGRRSPLAGGHPLRSAQDRL